MITLSNIQVTFETGSQPVTAVQDVSLYVDAGDVYGIVGYSGAGKSTLVRVMNLLQRPTAGSVTVNGPGSAGSAAQGTALGQEEDRDDLPAF